LPSTTASIGRFPRPTSRFAEEFLVGCGISDEVVTNMMFMLHKHTESRVNPVTLGGSSTAAESLLGGIGFDLEIEAFSGF
jgi:hypothetical protein